MLCLGINALTFERVLLLRVLSMAFVCSGKFDEAIPFMLKVKHVNYAITRKLCYYTYESIMYD